MAPCRRRYSTRLFKALAHDPQLLVIRPAPTTTSLDHLKPFKLSAALMAVHKDCYAPIGLIQQGGPRRRKTISVAAEATRHDHKPNLPPRQRQIGNVQGSGHGRELGKSRTRTGLN